MKDFLILCAKVALGLLIGFTLIYGGSGSLKQKADTVNKNATAGFSGIKFDTIAPTSKNSPQG
ncbi:hypothetical protein SH1V18_11890 [Vallitalea longa]|uniref:Uncharacterized protein n=1 Tax=Vallitalea longa TaxID=2936439 RepID=A0A9W5Y8X5_9FIRM|nr:hypothetical protein [Vallitalea longa]GKX28709.1 hypothetical protein SH1V18_11890 [Vallitalea longa]